MNISLKKPLLCHLIVFVLTGVAGCDSGSSVKNEVDFAFSRDLLRDAYQVTRKYVEAGNPLPLSDVGQLDIQLIYSNADFGVEDSRVLTEIKSHDLTFRKNLNAKDFLEKPAATPLTILAVDLAVPVGAVSNEKMKFNGLLSDGHSNVFVVDKNRYHEILACLNRGEKFGTDFVITDK
jgi:hypothetical protein